MIDEKNKDDSNKINNDDSKNEDTEVKFDFLDEEESNESKPENNEETYDKDELLPILLQQEEIENLKKQLEEVTREKDDLYDRLLRKLADFNNFKKRIEKERQDYCKFANADLIRDILPIIDNFEKALMISEDKDDPFYRGIELIYKQFIDVLRKHGVEEIKAEGEQFDPSFHEAVWTAEIENQEDNVIIEEYQKGYMMHDKLLRPSLVKVNIRKNLTDDSGKNRKEAGDNEESNRD